ncbi:sensor domain-containing protein [Mycolicibacterium pulveris]|uniref:sensor domain-containing protein n=1 Tax=Mycolicibacterium pulveris TaxID=36813 RepID=UPI003CFACB0B
MRSRGSTVVALSACVLLAGCSAQVADPPALRIAEVAKPSPVRALAQVLPSADELTAMLGAAGFSGQLVEGGPDVLLRSVGQAEATPADCVSTGYPLQHTVYDAGPVRTVASQSWAGGDAGGPSASGFFGVVQFATVDDAREFFAAAADKWHRCNGETLVLHHPGSQTSAAGRITDVTVDHSTISAIVLHDAGSTVQRALGIAADCVVEVEISEHAGPDPMGARDAVSVADLMLQQIG